jgi:hypothetical protein
LLKALTQLGDIATTLRARPDANHIAHLRKMVGHGMAVRISVSCRVV